MLIERSESTSMDPMLLTAATKGNTISNKFVKVLNVFIFTLTMDIKTHASGSNFSKKCLCRYNVFMNKFFCLGSEKAVMLLFGIGANINAANKNGTTALMAAARNGISLTLQI